MPRPGHGAHGWNVLVQARPDDRPIGQTYPTETLSVGVSGHSTHRDPGFEGFVGAEPRGQRSLWIEQVDLGFSSEPHVRYLDLTCAGEVGDLHEVVLRGRGKEDRSMDQHPNSAALLLPFDCLLTRPRD